MNKLPLKTMYIDIETSPLLCYVFRTGKTHITIDALIPDSMVKIICISYRWDGEKKTHNICWDENQDDKKMLEEFVQIAQEAECLIGHNEKNFDIKIINARIAYHRLSKQLPIVLIEDTLMLFRRAMNLPSMKLDYLLHYFGIKRKLHTDMMLWMRTCYYNDRLALQKMIKYCNRDVDSLHDLYKQLRTYLPSQINHAIIKGNSALCPNCGEDALYRNGVRTSGLGRHQRWACRLCGKSFKSGINEVKLLAGFKR